MMGTNFFHLFCYLVLFERIDHSHESLLLDLFFNIILHPSVSMCPLTHRIGKKEGHVVFDFFDQADCVFKFLVCFVAKATYEIAREGNTWNQVSNVMNKLDVTFSGMISSHSEQHIGVSTLGWEMYLLANISFGCYHMQQIIWEIFWMR